MKKTSVEDLFKWFEKYLKQETQFTEQDLRAFFADEFVIKTNEKTVHATLATYRDYLYKLKKALNGVQYHIEEIFQMQEVAVAVFIIELDFKDRPAQQLRAISIFKFNAEHRITEWREVFVDVNAQDFSYAPKD